MALSGKAGRGWHKTRCLLRRDRESLPARVLEKHLVVGVPNQLVAALLAIVKVYTKTVVAHVPGAPGSLTVALIIVLIFAIGFVSSGSVAAVVQALARHKRFQCVACKRLLSRCGHSKGGQCNHADNDLFHLSLLSIEA